MIARRRGHRRTRTKAHLEEGLQVRLSTRATAFPMVPACIAKAADCRSTGASTWHMLAGSGGGRPLACCSLLRFADVDARRGDGMAQPPMAWWYRRGLCKESAETG